MVSKNRSSVQVEPLEGRRMLSSTVIPAAGREQGVVTKALNQELHAAGTNLGQAYCSQEVPGDCGAETIEFLHPPGRV
jgi:hypothetical protein